MSTENYLSHLTLLYVEDDIDIREELESFFELRVKTLYVAKDGKEGIELFRKYNPDIVVSDINMPIMNGIKMAEAIKNENQNTQVILVTAFNDIDHMADAIDAGVDGYIVKPVDIKKLNRTIGRATQNLQNMRIAEKVNKDKELISTLHNFLDFSPNPIIVYEDSKVRYVNSKFLELSKKEEKSLLGNDFNLDILFQNRIGYISSIDNLQADNKENKVSIKGEFGRRILYILKDDINTLSDNNFTMYTFNDITMNEYRKLKIENYNLRLEKFVQHVNTIHVKKYKESLLSEATTSIQEEAKEIIKEKRELSDIEQTVLKNSRNGKAYSASEYAKELDSYILEDVNELNLIEDEIKDYLGIYQENKDLESLTPVANTLVKYASVISQLFEFEDLSFSIKSLAELLININMEDMDDNKHRKTEVFLSGFIDDLINWRMTIFVDQSANDIHYLDASLFSTILQLELVVSDKQAVNTDDDDDFELF